MHLQERLEIERLTKFMSGKLDEVDMKQSFNVVFTRKVAEQISDRIMLPYDKSLVIASRINVSVEGEIENDEDRKATEDLAILFGDLIVDYSKSLFDDGSYNIDVMENFAAQLSVSVG